MSTPDLDAIQARTEAATEGPWANYGDLTHEVYPVRTDEDDEPDNIASVVPSLADAHFIANARTDVPALLAYARDLEARIGRVDKLAVHLDEHSPHRWAADSIRAALTATDAS